MDLSTILADELNGIAIQLISFIILIAAAYYIPYFLLSVLRIPHPLKKLASFGIAALISYHGYFEIFLNTNV